MQQTETPTATPIPSQPIVTLSYSVNAGEFNSVEGLYPWLVFNQGDQIVFQCRITGLNEQSATIHTIHKPYVAMPDWNKSTDADATTFSISFQAIPQDCMSEYSFAFSVSSTIKSYSFNVYFRINLDADNDDIILSQGYGGTSIIQVRNMDPKRGPVTEIIRSFRGASGKFAEAIGGAQRATYVSVGDVNGDSSNEYVISFGPISSETPAAVPNAVVVRDGKSLVPIGNSFSAFPTGSSRPVEYNYGDIHTAVGNFTGTAPEQIAVAQGIGGNGVIRLFQYTGQPAPNAYKVVGQYQPLKNQEWAKIGYGAVPRDGFHIAAEDIDQDGLDELLISIAYNHRLSSPLYACDFINNGKQIQIFNMKRKVYPLNNPSGFSFVFCDIDGDGAKEFVEAGPMPYAHTICGLIVWKRGRNSTYLNLGRYPVFYQVANPSGSVSLTAGEFNGCEADGEEIVVSTSAFTYWNPLTRFWSFYNPAPKSVYEIIKINFNSQLNSIGGVQTLYKEAILFRFPAFLGEFNPTSGAVHVAAGRVH